jgi:multidrug resistance efflux pump
VDVACRDFPIPLVHPAGVFVRNTFDGSARTLEPSALTTALRFLPLLVGVALGGISSAYYFAKNPNPFGAGVAVERRPSATVMATPSPATQTNEKVIGIGYADVEGGATPLSLPLPGAVQQIFIREGQKVRKGQALIRLNDAKAAAQVVRAEAAVLEAKTKLARARRAPAVQELELKQQEQALVVARSQRTAAERHIETLRGLAGSETVPEEKLLAALDQMDALNATLSVEQLKLQRMRLENPAEQMQLAEAALKAAEAELGVAKQNHADHSLAAPRDGDVLRVLVSAGQLAGINPLSPAIWFKPDEPTIVRTEVDQAFTGQMKEGMIAEFYDDNRQKRLGTGKVVRLAPWIAQRRSLLDEPFQRNDVRTLECMVSVDDAVEELRMGQRLRVVFIPGAATESPTKIAAR